jgi:putative protease
VKHIPELLSPAGSVNSVKAAVNAGCDAVYVGSPALSARGSADSLTDKELTGIIEYCHLRGVKVYITVNIVYADSELPNLFKHMSEMYKAGADAFIMQDMGAAAARQLFPEIELHASTQMTAQSLNDVLYLQKAGFNRIILSRELSVDEIKNITAGTSAGIEIFVHGALCYCYSGRCLMSGHIGKRSGNRGKCAQPCRQNYTLRSNGTELSGYLLSAKDLMTYAFLDELIETGAVAFKIEGRSKSPEYVAQVTRAYRERLDLLAETKNARPPDPGHPTLRNLHQIFNRGGFTDGYYKNPRGGTHMLSLDSPKPVGAYIGRVAAYNRVGKTCKILLEHDINNGDGIYVAAKNGPYPGTYINKPAQSGEIAEIRLDGAVCISDSVYKSYDKKLMDELKTFYVSDTRRVTAKASVRAVLGEPVSLRVDYGGISFTVNGAAVAQSQTKPVTAERIVEQLSKTGGTPFIFEFDGGMVTDNIFISMAELNELRRAAVTELETRIIACRKRASDVIYEQLPVMAAPTPATPRLSVLVRNEPQFNGAIASKSVGRVYFEFTNHLLDNLDLYTEKCRANDIGLFIALPGVIDGYPYLETLENSGIDGYLCRNFGELHMLSDSKKRIAVDSTFNIVNSRSYSHYAADTVCLSYENTANSISRITAAADNAEIIVHGKIPIMTTKQCLLRTNNNGCEHKTQGGYTLADKTGAKFSAVTDCRLCCTHIFSDRPLYMLHKLEELKACNASWYRISLSDEDADETLNLCLAYKGAISGARNAGAEAMADGIVGGEFTYGYFFKGFD